MNVLVLHNNYPGQFKFILPSILARGHKVIFLSLESHGNKISGVKHYKIGPTTKNNKQVWNVPYKGLGKKLSHAEIFRAAFQKLRDSGFHPDITIFHSGWGIGCFLKSIFPKTKSFAYAEWWFKWDSVEANYDPSSKYSPSSSLNEKVSHHYFNLTQALEISEADYVWSPTHWQRSQFPKSIQNRIEVIHEGIDTNVFMPSNYSYHSSRPINITYTSRALEPMRCYNHFYNIIAPVMQSYPTIRLTIVGKEKAVYRPVSYADKSLFEESIELFTKLNLNHRIRHYSRLDSKEYVKLLSNSHVHFYFSRPFVASWSLLEAMSSGCCIISNESPMTSEFLGHKTNALIVDSTYTNKSVDDINDYLSDEALINKTASNARSSALKFDFREQLKTIRAYIGY
ncbi:glycosyltransferase [bacterium]|nr:glycosyltransferase [bacterium]